MFPDEFDYHEAESVDHAVELLGEYGGQVELLAGGHSLLPAMKTGLSSPDVLVDPATSTNSTACAPTATRSPSAR